MAKMSKPIHGILTLRRAVFSLFVAIVTVIMAGGVVGFAAADSEPVPAGAPGTLQLEEPMVGDQGTYALFHYTKEGNRLTPTGPGTSILVFRLDPTTTLRDKDGIPRQVVPITYAALSAISGQSVPAQQGGSLKHLGDIDYYDFSTDETVGHAYLNKIEQVFGTTRVETATNSTVFTRGYFWPGSYDLPGCGLRNVFQGMAVPLDDQLALFESCNFQTGTGRGQYQSIDDPRFGFSGVSELHGRDHFVFSNFRDGQRVEVWFDPDRPYPSMFVFTKDDGESADVISLTDFTRGKAPARSLLPSSSQPAPDLIWSQREPWGPSDDGVPHAFPLSAAWARILTDEGGRTVRAYLSSHPAAAVHEASYYLAPDGRGVIRQWTLRIADAGSDLGVTVSAKTRGAGSRVPDPICVACPETYTALAGETQYSIRTFQPQATSEGPRARFDADELPAKMPTVSSLLARWSGYATNASGEFQWAFIVRCADDACRQPELSIAAGASNLTSTAMVPGVTGGDLITSRDELQLTFGPTPGTAKGVYHVTWEASRPGYGILPASQTAPADRAQPVKTHGNVFWSVPTGSLAVGAGALAAFAGLVYWIWPALRAGALGLFTRLDRPRILEHPVRRDIVGLVESNPGIHFSEIVRRLGLGNGNADHHVRHLVAHRLLAEVKAEGFTCYYVPGAVGADAARGLPSLKSAGARSVLREIARRPGINAKEVAQAVNMSGPTVHYHVVRLHEGGLIDSDRTPHGLALRPTDLATRALELAG